MLTQLLPNSSTNTNRAKNQQGRSQGSHVGILGPRNGSRRKLIVIAKSFKKDKLATFLQGSTWLGVQDPQCKNLATSLKTNSFYRSTSTSSLTQTLHYIILHYTGAVLLLLKEKKQLKSLHNADRWFFLIAYVWMETLSSSLLKSDQTVQCCGNIVVYCIQKVEPSKVSTVSDSVSCI